MAKEGLEDLKWVGKMFLASESVHMPAHLMSNWAASSQGRRVNLDQPINPQPREIVVYLMHLLVTMQAKLDSARPAAAPQAAPAPAASIAAPALVAEGPVPSPFAMAPPPARVPRLSPTDDDDGDDDGDALSGVGARALLAHPAGSGIQGAATSAPPAQRPSVWQQTAASRAKQVERKPPSALSAAGAVARGALGSMDTNTRLVGRASSAAALLGTKTTLPPFSSASSTQSENQPTFNGNGRF